MAKKSEARNGKDAIDYRKIPRNQAAERPFPAALADEYRVHIAPAAYDRMKRHAATSDEVELCGVLVGQVCRDDQGVYLSITGAIEGEGANTYGTQVTFTQQTWDHIHSVREREFPDAQIVGWFHTHPGFGVFLSGMDTFVHENFFNAPHQVAIVLETKTKQEGCFGWVDGKIVPLQRYWVGDREVRLATGEAEPFREERLATAEAPEKLPAGFSSRSADQTEPAPVGFKSLIMLAVLCMAFGVFWGYSLIRRAMLQVLETEFYSLLEFAGINSAAAQDFQEIRGKLVSLRQAAEKAGESPSAKGLVELEELLAGYESDYVDRDRGSFRKRLNQVVQKRQYLGQRVDGTDRLAHELQMSVVDIYLLRVQDIVDRAKVTDMRDLSPRDVAMIRLHIERILKIEPAYKEVLQRMEPELMRFLYSAPEATGKTAPGAKQGK
ncbi:MAG: Mov34/MPN/PAD-1 family protein [Lentisphaeria bacterium]|jgi:proteasome lid subunit RPN8/RPN11|nr:Mov34/MPN/PAD-1 family protein [Lentisphaeria bacterium]